MSFFRIKTFSVHFSRITNLVRIKRNPSLKFQPGDHLSVHAKNEESLVNKLLERITSNVDVDVPVKMESLEGKLRCQINLIYYI